MLRAIVVAAALMAMLMPLPGAAQSQGNATAGLDVARRWCANCHVVEPGQRAGSDAVPTFAAIARLPNSTSGSLAVFLRAPHAASKMPDFHLSETDIDNAIAYLLSLRP